jgi:hypothetical protein
VIVRGRPIQGVPRGRETQPVRLISIVVAVVAAVVILTKVL